MNIQALRYLLFLPFLVACKTITPRLVCALPDVLRESSGLVVQSPNSFWTINDSGGEAALYQFDSTGRIRHIVKLLGATNNDFEELTTDAMGNFYVGDIGNNAETRRDLAFYKVLKTDLATLNDSLSSVNAIRIPFRYADQTAFPPTQSAFHFDAEAFLVRPDSVFVITKDFDSKPYGGQTHIYGLKNTHASTAQIATPLSVLATNKSWKYRGAITAAAVSPDQSKVVLMSYQRLWIFTDFGSKPFWEGRRKELRFGLRNFAQREGVAFSDNCTIYMTSEKNVVKGIKFGGNLSRLNVCDYLKR
jgi:hypothetical protein